MYKVDWIQRNKPLTINKRYSCETKHNIEFKINLSLWKKRNLVPDNWWEELRGVSQKTPGWGVKGRKKGSSLPQKCNFIKKIYEYSEIFIFESCFLFRKGGRKIHHPPLLFTFDTPGGIHFTSCCKNFQNYEFMRYFDKSK